MDTVEKILNCIGLKVSDMHSLDETDSLIVSRMFDAVKDYAMYHDKNPELEAQCEKFEMLLRQHINQDVMRRKELNMIHDIEVLKNAISAHNDYYLKKNVISKALSNLDNMKVAKNFTLKSESQEYLLDLLSFENKLTIASLKESQLSLESDLSDARNNRS